MTTDFDPSSILTDALLERIDERTMQYDRDNAFCGDDLEDLRASGYLDVALPESHGGPGRSLADYSALARRLAYVAPATALAVNMHVYWTGVAADLERAGDSSSRYILDQAAAGKILAAIHGERGNDVPLFLSTATADPTDGGWIINGHKIFGSLSPVWDVAGFHAMDTSDPDNPRIVHGFVNKDDVGVEIKETWDTLGMRATQSHDTILRDVRVPDSQVVKVCPPGFAGADMFHVGIFAWALLGFASVYLGAAKRAFDITIEQLPKRQSMALTRSMAHHPEFQHHVADMRIAYDTAEALLDRLVADWSAGVPHEDWPVRILVGRQQVMRFAYEVVDLAMDASGGGAVFKTNRLEQLFRDVRMGRFHPGNTFLAHEVIAKLCLGLDPDDELRWG